VGVSGAGSKTASKVSGKTHYSMVPRRPNVI
jgi:hypothetical protein